MHDGVPFRGLYDILGLLLSSMGVAPAGATSHTFYLPLVAMYGRWCKMLGDPLPCPTMFNCTWISEGEDRGRFFLGASIGRYKQANTSWTQSVKEARFSLINDADMELKGYTMVECPASAKGICFGNCAEVYPLLHILKGNTNPGAVYGIAVHRKGVLHSQYEDGVSGWAWKAVRRLCANCEELIRMWGGLPANFEPFADVGGCHCNLHY
ncbi:unnamed protein product [Penicillium nalgiovense]|uniref:Uncharacterized protein n=1 Tax=Penicillium nalgiovense TaxID=60175 RepID=A0A9W4HUD2_PENNA|nr:unnamed protein product [Penicillium nalgiovense]CAG8116839.1 unnamed protein product [Penicillium nalgiovense]CAG8126914.1 unnamed protein product [Penicillium nalgiovense]CAG8143947.1 unnamed protein product [Penicillium nalgiovense]CAG8151974.1 unnamed protein product [Penicillium nalgiovense]